VVYLFGETELDPIAQKIIEAVAAGPKTQNDIMDLFQRNVPARRLAAVLEDLQERGRITLTKEGTGAWASPLSLEAQREKRDKPEMVGG